MVVNWALVEFQPKEVFGWHLSIIIKFEDLIDNQMPSQADRDVVDPFGDQLDTELKGDPSHPNALFLARMTWNGTREVIYRVHDPEVANELLQTMIREESYPREFDFRMEGDPTWELARWHLSACEDK